MIEILILLSVIILYLMYLTKTEDEDKFITYLFIIAGLVFIEAILINEFYDLPFVCVFGYCVIERVYAYFKMREYHSYPYRVFEIYFLLSWPILFWKHINL